MKFVCSLAVAALFAVPSFAQAQEVPKDKASVRLASCDTVEHKATFQGTMATFGRATGLQMRFTLQARDSITHRWARVGAPPPFEEWLTAQAGNARYVYDKSVDNLPVGAAYRVVVRFRFRDANGTIVARTQRHSRKCRQPDERANLQPERVRAGAIQADGTRVYEVTMANTGESMSAPSSVALDVNAVRQPFVVDPGLAPGATTAITFVAPACAMGSNVTATVDINSEVDERDETDNALTLPCPEARRIAP
jgi:hypothetical protein